MTCKDNWEDAMGEIEEPNERLLRRAEAAEQAQKTYADPLDALRDMVGYGTNLIPRVHAFSDKGDASMVVIGVLLKQIVEMLDAIDVLMSHGNSFPALLQVRAAFEASLYMDWILQADSDKRALYYIVANLRDEATWARRSISGSAEKTAYETALGKTIKHSDPAMIDSEGRKQLTGIEAILANPKYQPIDAAFTAARGKRYEPHWYQVLGVKSLRKMAEQVNRVVHYEVIYDRGSDAMHAGLYKDHLKTRKGEFVMRSLRNLADGRDVFVFTMIVAMHSFQAVLTHYRPDEVKAGALARRYVERWQKAFFSIPDVTYNYL
jgi:hypothetical protein